MAINLASMGRPRMVWLEDLKSVNSKFQVLCAEVVRHTEGHMEGDPTHGVRHLVRDDAKERLIAHFQPLEVQVHLLEGLDEDNVEPTSFVDEGLRE
jgi:hypothetical protein